MIEVKDYDPTSIPVDNRKPEGAKEPGVSLFIKGSKAMGKEKETPAEKRFRARFAAHNGQPYASHHDAEDLINSYVRRWGHDDEKMRELHAYYTVALSLAKKWVDR